MDLDTAKEIAIDFISNKYPDCFAALITGSCVTGNFSKNSDIDILVFDENINIPEKSKALLGDGNYIDLYIIPKNNVLRLLLEDFYNLEGPLPTMLSVGIILKDNNEYLLNLIEFIKDSLYKLYPTYNQNQIQNALMILCSLVDDLSNDDLDLGELYLIISNILDHLIRLNLNLNKAMYGHTKQRAKYLKQYCPEFYNKMMANIQDFYGNQNRENIIQFFNKEIEEFGILQKKFNTKAPLEYTNEQVLLLQIDLKYFNVDSIQNFPVLSSLLSESNLHLRYIYSDKSTLTFVLALNGLAVNQKQLKLFFHEFFNISIFSAAINIYAKGIPLFIASKEVIGLVEDQLERFYKMLRSEMLAFYEVIKTEDLNLFLGLVIWKKFIIAVDLTPSDHKAFATSTFKIWAPAMFDFDKNCSFELVIAKKEYLLNQLNQSILQNIEVLKNVIQDFKLPGAFSEFNGLIESIDDFFRNNFSHFIEAYRILKVKGQIDLPVFEMKAFFYESVSLTEDFYIYRILLEKFYSILFNDNKYIIPYVYSVLMTDSILL